MLRHRAGLLRTDFKRTLGKVSYHVPCHLRVQNIGLKTRDVLRLVPDTTLEVIERCSGHNGTYAVKKEFRAASVKIGRPVMQKVANAKADYYASDCPMAGRQIESELPEPRPPTHPLALAAHRLRLDVNKLTVDDLLTLERYARERNAFRARVMEHKGTRQLAVGPNLRWCFEDRLTIQYQVQEMLRTERIFEAEGIAEELETYNPLIPDGSNWKVTLLIEFPDPDERRARACDVEGRGGCLLDRGGRPTARVCDR